MQLIDCGGHQPRAARAERMTERNRATVRVHAGVIICHTEISQHGEPLRGERFIEFNHVHLAEGQAGECEHFARSRRWPKTHDARRDARARHAHHAGARREAVFRSRDFAREQQRAGTVVNARCVTRSHGAIGAHDRFQFGEGVQRGVARMLVLVDDDRITFFLRDRNWRYLSVKEAALLRLQRIRLRAQRHFVLRFTPDFELIGDVLSGLGHGVNAVFFFHQFVDEAPADGGVVHRVVATKRAVHFWHHKRRTAHALHATGNHHVRLARADRSRRCPDRIQTGATQAIDRRPRHLNGQAREQRGHVRNVSIVFACLIGATIEHVSHQRPIDAGVARHQRPDRNRAKIIGAHRSEDAAVATERRADGVTDEGFIHKLATLKRVCEPNCRSVDVSRFLGATGLRVLIPRVASASPCR